MPIFTSEIDTELNDQAYIVPGLGDAETAISELLINPCRQLRHGRSRVSNATSRAPVHRRAETVDHSKNLEFRSDTGAVAA